jgi:hypothetical protein
MKKIYIIILVSLFSISCFSQDKIRFGVDASISFIPIFLSGPMDVGDHSSTIRGGQVITQRPVYRHVDTTALAGNIVLHLCLNVPFYKNDVWSTGIKAQAGFGLMGGIKAADGLKSIVIDFPEFLYLRRYKKTDYAVLVGYKYSYTSIPYQLMLVGFDFNPEWGDGKTTIRLYGSPFSYKYYNLYTNGEIKPAMKIYEFGLVLQTFF